MTKLIEELEPEVMVSQVLTIIHNLIASIKHPMRRLGALELQQMRSSLKTIHRVRSNDSLWEQKHMAASTVSKVTA